MGTIKKNSSSYHNLFIQKNEKKKKRQLAPKKRQLAPKERQLAPKKRQLAPKKRQLAPMKRPIALRKNIISMSFATLRYCWSVSTKIARSRAPGRNTSEFGFTEGGRVEHCMFMLDYIANM